MKKTSSFTKKSPSAGQKSFSGRGGKPFGRSDKGGYFGKTERDSSSGRSERPSRFAKKDDRPERSDRPRTERPHSDRPRTERSDRPYSERSERPARFSRDDKAPSFARGERAEKSDRPRTERPASGSRFGRDERPQRRTAPKTEGKTWDKPTVWKKKERTADGEERSFDKPEKRGRDRRGMDPRTPRAKPDFKKSSSRKGGASKRPEAAPALPIKKIATHKGLVLWGLHAVRSAWLNADRDCFQIWGTESGLASLEATFVEGKKLQLSRPTPQKVDRSSIDEMLPSGSVHQGIAMEVAPLAEVELFDLIQEGVQPDLIVVLDQVTDPHNVGAILRSAAAFGAGALIITERNAPSTTGVMAKTACGAAEHVPQIQVVNLARTLTELQQAGYWCVGLAEEATRDIGALDLSGKTALVLGAEGDGLRRLTREGCDELARLPTGGPIGSLNVSNAAAVALYEVRRQKSKFKPA